MPEEAEEIEEAFEDSLDSIERCQAALERLAEFAVDQNPEHLRSGLSLLARGLSELAELAAQNSSALSRLEQPDGGNLSGNFSW